MDIAQLGSIIALLDMDKIEKKLQEKGFRLANPDFVWEYKPSLFKKESAIAEVEHEDKEKDLSYAASLFQEIEGYEGIVFVEVILYQIHKSHGGLKTPKKILLYTSAPINEEYELGQVSIVKCSKCKRKYPKKELTEWFGQSLCEKCLTVAALAESHEIKIEE